MRSLNYHFQLLHLLKRFKENLILSIEQQERSYEFLFENRKYLPFEGQPELHEILLYIKDNMEINGLYTLNDVLKHYASNDKVFIEFLDELTAPTPGDVWIGHSNPDCAVNRFHGPDTNDICISKSGVQNGIVAYSVIAPLIPMNYVKSGQVDNPAVEHSQQCEVDGDSEAEDCMC